MPYRPEHVPLYEAAREFAQRCLVGDQSLLWPDRYAWTAHNVAEVRRRHIDAPLGGEGTFDDVLVQHLLGAPADQWAIVCDTYYVYYLPVANIRLTTKQQRIERLRLVGDLPAPAPDVWEAQDNGFTKISVRYNLKHPQFRFILLLAERLKAAGDAQAVLASPAQLQQVVDDILESIPERHFRARDMRHALLYLLFPEHFEPILDTEAKTRIVRAYADRAGHPLPEDPDQALRAVREALAPEYNVKGQPFRFSDEPLSQPWLRPRRLRAARPASRLLLPAEPEGPTPEAEDEDVARVLRTLGFTRNIILSGPPGTGKTYLASRVAHALVGPQRRTARRATEAGRIVWTTFHQSYAYEDFVEGIRPKARAPGELSYPVVPGPLLEVSRRAARQPGKNFVLVIDEINRGNIAKVFGELITLVEDDKRGRLSVRLPYSGQLFSVPDNLFVIGTMNTADRSIALLDVALRRRFAFIEVPPRPDLLAGTVVRSPENEVALDDLLRGLNDRIRRHLGRDYVIGHSYLLRVKAAPPERRLEALEFVWNDQIVPLLHEYFYSQPDHLRDVLAPFVLEESEGGLPGAPPDAELGHASGEDLLAALGELALGQ